MLQNLILTPKAKKKKKICETAWILGFKHVSLNFGLNLPLNSSIKAQNMSQKYFLTTCLHVSHAYLTDTLAIRALSPPNLFLHTFVASLFCRIHYAHVIWFLKKDAKLFGFYVAHLFSCWLINEEKKNCNFYKLYANWNKHL